MAKTKVKARAKHPLQPLIIDKQGTVRFKANAIVRYILDLGTAKGCADMNMLAMMPFSDEDRQQFAQLIGYSLSGYGELTSYVTDEAYEAAAKQAPFTEPNEEQEFHDRVWDILTSHRIPAGTVDVVADEITKLKEK